LEEGLPRRPEGQRYCSNVNIPTQRRFRIGHALESSDSFSHSVSHGIRWAAMRNQIDLIEVENLYSVMAKLRNAQNGTAESRLCIRIPRTRAHQFTAVGLL
jgi:hypothetical protein